MRYAITTQTLSAAKLLAEAIFEKTGAVVAIEEIKPTAKSVPDLMTVEPSACDGDYFLTVPIDPNDPYGSFKKLPAAVSRSPRTLSRYRETIPHEPGTCLPLCPACEARLILRAALAVERATRPLSAIQHVPG